MLKKNQTSISQDIEEKILSMYAKGMTTSDIETHIRDIYGVEVSDTTVSRITDKILPIAKEWQQRPLESVYAVVFIYILTVTQARLRQQSSFQSFRQRFSTNLRSAQYTQAGFRA